MKSDAQTLENSAEARRDDDVENVTPDETRESASKEAKEVAGTSTAPPPATVPEDDPFSKTQKSNQGSGFRVPNMKFPLRGEKDHTKDYQNLGVSDIEWLVKMEPKDSTKSAEALRAETANLTVRLSLRYYTKLNHLPDVGKNKKRFPSGFHRRKDI